MGKLVKRLDAIHISVEEEASILVEYLRFYEVFKSTYFPPKHEVIQHKFISFNLLFDFFLIPKDESPLRVQFHARLYVYIPEVLWDGPLVPEKVNNLRDFRDFTVFLCNSSVVQLSIKIVTLFIHWPASLLKVIGEIGKSLFYIVMLKWYK